MNGNAEASDGAGAGAGAVGGTDGVGTAGIRPRALKDAISGFSAADVTGGCGVLLCGICGMILVRG